MKQNEIEQLVNLRKELIESFSKLREYKNHKNAIMKEADHAKVLHSTIVKIDLILKDYVKFE